MTLTPYWEAAAHHQSCFSRLPFERTIQFVLFIMWIKQSWAASADICHSAYTLKRKSFSSRQAVRAPNVSVATLTSSSVPSRDLWSHRAEWIINQTPTELNGLLIVGIPVGEVEEGGPTKHGPRYKLFIDQPVRDAASECCVCILTSNQQPTWILQIQVTERWNFKVRTGGVMLMFLAAVIQFDAHHKPTANSHRNSHLFPPAH